MLRVARLHSVVCYRQKYGHTAVLRVSRVYLDGCTHNYNQIADFLKKPRMINTWFVQGLYNVYFT